MSLGGSPAAHRAAGPWLRHRFAPGCETSAGTGLPVVWLGLLSPALAQFPGDRAAGTENEDNVFFPADRASLQRLATAEQLLADERFDEAVRFLDSILQAPEDFFFQPSRASGPTAA